MRRARQALSPGELDQRPAVALGAVANPTMTLSRTAVVPPITQSEDAGSASTSYTGAGAGAGTSGSGRYLSGLGASAGRKRLVALIAVILCAVAAVLFFTAGPGARTTVPRVVGSTTEVAQRALTVAHLDASVVRSFDESVKPGVVLAGDPAAGSEIRRGSTVTLTVSRGPERYEVPQLIGRTEADARQRVTDTRLTVGKVSKAFSETVPQGQVISTAPVANTSVKRASPVNLVISDGRQPIAITDWTGRPASQAIAAMTKAKLKVTATKQDWSDTVPKGSVLSQSPTGGTLFQGDPVTLVISRGPQLVVVPNVVSQQERPARQALESLGFKVKVERALGGFFRTVRLQSVAAGTLAPQGSTITLTVV
jgi:serine/threonine-protein kinase